MEKDLKKMGVASILATLICIIMGFIIAYNPNTTFKIMSCLVGSALIVSGIISVIQYFKTKGMNGLDKYELAYGIFSIVLGFIIAMASSMFEILMRLSIGIWIVYCGVIRLTLLVFNIRKKLMTTMEWIIALIINILILMCGIYILVIPGIIVKTIGITMIVFGIMDMVEEIIFLNSVKNK